ncbi:hypothetical protein B0H14DRAFT_3527778 [Mycena olivaceomarginata]|nr:hypothetical protein B0H14DRAFT_3527778 [Mycena olivaceomarginata]
MAGDKILQKDHEDSGSEDEEEDVIPKVEIDPSTLTPLSPEVISKQVHSCAASTSGMSMTACKRKADYEPRRKWGLKPLKESGATYLVSGHIIHAGRVDPRDSLFVSENIGHVGRANTVLEELVVFEGCVCIYSLCFYLISFFSSSTLHLVYRATSRAPSYTRVLRVSMQVRLHALLPFKSRLLVACTGDSAPATTSKYGPGCDSPLNIQCRCLTHACADSTFVILRVHVTANIKLTASRQSHRRVKRAARPQIPFPPHSPFLLSLALLPLSLILSSFSPRIRTSPRSPCSVRARYAGLLRAMSGALHANSTSSEYAWEDGGECAAREAASGRVGHGSAAAPPLGPPVTCARTPCARRGSILIAEYYAALQRAGCAAQGRYIHM